MRRRFIFLAGLFVLAGLTFASCTQSQSDKKTPKALFIILDGIPADVIEKLNPGAIAEISKEGGFTRAYVGGRKETYNETPTISAPGYI